MRILEDAGSARHPRYRLARVLFVLAVVAACSAGAAALWPRAGPLPAGLSLLGLSAIIVIAGATLTGGTGRGRPAAAADSDEPNETHRREIALRAQAEADLRALIDASPVGILVVDSRGRIELVSQEIERAFGYPRSELMGESIEMLLPKRLRRSHVGYRTEFASDPLPRPMGRGRDLRGLRSNGDEFPIEVGLAGLRRNGESVVLATVMDITERKEVERLEHEFVSAVSHELRTPLTAVLGALGLLTGGVIEDIGDRALRLIEIAQSSSLQLQRLIDDIVEVEKLEAGHFRLELDDFDAAALVEGAARSLSCVAEHEGITLEASTESEEPVTIRGDRDRLMQVLANLVANAVKFSPAGSVVEIVLHAPTEESVRCSVADRGPGIEIEQRRRIFERFVQVDTSPAREVGGAGLGLAISKALVLQHGGQIGVSPRPGGGSVFYFTVPRAPAPDDRIP